MEPNDRTVSDNSGSQTLFKALKQLSPGSIYTLAPRGEVFDAMTLIRNNPVNNIYWVNNRSTLMVEVKDHGISECTISIANGELTSKCDCRPRTACRHIVVALMTLKILLVPESFKDIPFNIKYMRALEGLLANPNTSKGTSLFRLIVLRTDSDVSILPAIGTVSATIQDRGMTQRQIRFMELLRFPINKQNIFQTYLETVGDDAPIVYLHGGKEHSLQFFPESVRTPRTQLDVSDGIVTVSKVFENGNQLADISFVTTRYYFDISARRIELIDNVVGWKFWDDVSLSTSFLTKGITRTNARLTMGVQDFNKLGTLFPINTDSQLLMLSVNGTLANIEERLLLGKILIREAEDEEFFTLCSSMNFDDTAYPLSAWPFGLLMERERWRFGPALRSKKRFLRIVSTGFDLLHCKTSKEQNALLREAFSGEEFLNKKNISEAKEIAKEFAESCRGSAPVLRTDGSKWIKHSMDRREQARLIEIPFRMFGVAGFTDTKLPGEMFVPRSELMPRLGELQTKIEAAGFGMRFNGKTIRIVKWDISLDATHSTIDWFELRPEVKCEGAEVSASEWEEALKGGGMYLKDGEIVMLDSETKSILTIFPKQEKSHTLKSGLVRIPRLQIFDWLHLRKQGVDVRLSPKDEKIFASILSFNELPVAPLPNGIDATLRHYQIDGYNWLAFLYEHRFGACLADDMGLGKTLQAITLLAGLHEKKITSHADTRLPHLIVVPPTLLFNWESELARFSPALTIITYRGADRSTNFSGVDVVLTSYGIVHRDAEKLAEQRFDVIIFDEAQAVKNIQNATTSACRGLKGIFSLSLTGTPIENHLGEYYSVMDISVPGLLGEYAAFRRSMSVTGPFLDMLIRRTRPFILRRSKTMIASELPPKIETDIYLELTDRQKSLYTKTVQEVKATVNEAFRSNATGQARIIALTAILRLRQLCLSPEILLSSTTEPSPKVEFLLNQLEELFDEGHSVLVFSQFTRFLDIVEKRLAGTTFAYMRLDGSTPMGERKKLVHRFQESEKPMVFLLSLKAGGKGLNLTRATYVFHLDPWWNPAVEDQASDRAHRIGQNAQVTITRLVMRHTIEEKMMELKKRKLALYKALLDDATTGGGAGISKEDFDYLLT